MDPNLLPNDLRGKEGKEQSRHRKSAGDFAVDLNLPQSAKAKPAASAKSHGLFASLFGRPVSPIISYSHVDSKPLIKTEAKAFAPNMARSRQQLPVERRPYSGDSWSSIIKGMFGGGRKRRIDFRMASDKSAAVKPQASAIVPSSAKAPILPPLPAAAQPKPHVVNPVRKAEKEKPRKETVNSGYHSAPKRERSAEFNVNLMPQELLARLSTDSTNNLKAILAAVFIPLAIITLAYIGIVLLQSDLKSRMAAKQQEFDALHQQIGDFIARENENNLVADKVAVIKKLSDNKLLWTNFFAYLEKYTIDGIYFTNLTADTSGVMSLPGVADNYQVLAKQLAVFSGASEFIKDAKLMSAQEVSESKAGVTGIGFQIRLTLQDNIFNKTKTLK